MNTAKSILHEQLVLGHLRQIDAPEQLLSKKSPTNIIIEMSL